MDAQLSDRQQRLLAMVVQDYVHGVQPVASGRLVRQHHLGISTATVRHELAALEAMGLLRQPHTSAGRVPTVAGYRYFVEHLMHSAAIPVRERRTIRHQFHQAGGDPDRWMRLAAAVVAQVSGVAGLVAAQQRRPAALRHVDLVDLEDGAVHLVAVLDDGSVQHARWRPEQPFDAASLERIGRRLNAAIAETGRVRADDAEAPAGLESSAVDRVRRLVRQADRATATPQLYHAGLTQILYAPEFADGDRLRGVVELLEHGHGLEPIIDRLPPSGVQVIIGGEPPLERAPYMTLVLARFGQAPLSGGVLGVVGPTRLAYERAVSMVGFVSSLMNQLMAGEAV